MKGYVSAGLSGLILLCWSIVGFAAQQAQYKFEISAIPDWVVEPPKAPEKAQNEEVGAHYLLANQQVRFDGQQQQSYSQYQFRLNDYSAIESESDIRVVFDPAYEMPHFHFIDIIRDGQRINRLDKQKLKFISKEDEQSSNIYGGQVSAVLLLEDVRIGDIIDYGYSIKGTNPVFANNFSYFFSLGYGVAVDNLFTRVLASESLNLQYKLGNIADNVKVSKLGKMLDYRMQIQYAPAVLGESDTPDWFDPYPWIHFSQYSDWQSVYAWASSLFEVKGELDGELKAFIESLKPLEKSQIIAKATQFVQDDIRYLGLELGENSHRPHHPNETFTNRYGDCKDKSLLLSTILNKLDIKAWPALVSTTNRGHLSRYLPAHNLFNHAIVNIEHDGQNIWLDPTISYQGSSLDSIHQPGYGKALLIKPGTTDLVEAIPSKPVASAIEVEELWQAADYTSAVIRTITTTYRGREAEQRRYKLSTIKLKDMERNFLNYYAKTFPKIRPLESISYEDDREQNVLVVREKYLVPGYWKMGENNAEFELYTDFVSSYISLPKTIVREHPMALPAIDSVRHRVTLSLPYDIDFSEDVGTEVVEDDYFKFISTIEYDRRRISYANHYLTKAKEVKAEDAAGHIELLRKARNMVAYRNSIVNFQGDPGYSEMKTLMNTLSKQVIGAKRKGGVQ